MKKIFFITLLFCNAFITPAQTQYIQWQRSLGGSMDDAGVAVQSTTDGGYIVTGESRSNNGDVTVNHGDVDYWVVKLDSLGAIEWQKSLGGTLEDKAKAIQQTTDGGYIVAGSSTSNNGDVTGNHGNMDGWVVKLNSTGTIQWQKTVGGTSDDNLESVWQTADGGYVVAGDTRSNNGDVTGGPLGNNDCWVVKLDSLGVIQWQNPLGGTMDDYAYAVQQTADSGYIVAGGVYSNDSAVSGNHGFIDYWVFKLNSAGVLQWQKTLGGVNWDYASAIQQTTDGGYIVTGISDSNTGDVTGNHGGYDQWVAKLNSTGTIQWERSLGGTGTESGQSVYQTADGGYIVAGMSDSNDNDVSGNHGGADCWIVKLDSTGTIQWQKPLGGTGNDSGLSIYPTTGSGYIIAGSSASNDGDVSGNHGGYDYWVVKLDTAFVSVSLKENEILRSITVFPNPSNGKINFSNLAAGEKENTIEIYDITGRSIYKTRSKNNDQTIDLSEKDKGVYFYKISNSNKIIQQGKIILQ